MNRFLYRHDLEQARAALNQQHEAKYTAQEAEAELVSFVMNKNIICII